MRWTHTCFIKLICYVSLTLIVVVPSRGQSPVDSHHRRSSTVCPYSGRVYFSEPITESPEENPPSTETGPVAAEFAAAPAPAMTEVVQADPSDYDNSSDYNDYDYSEYEYTGYDYQQSAPVSAVATAEGRPEAAVIEADATSDEVVSTVNSIDVNVAAVAGPSVLEERVVAPSLPTEVQETPSEAVMVAPALPTNEVTTEAEGEGWEYADAEYDYYVEEFEAIREAELGSAEPDTRPYEEVINEVSNDGYDEYDPEFYSVETVGSVAAEAAEAEGLTIAVDQCREEMVEADTLVEEEADGLVADNQSTTTDVCPDPYAQEVYEEAYHLETGYDSAYDEAMSKVTSTNTVEESATDESTVDEVTTAEVVTEDAATEDVANEDTVYDDYLVEQWAAEAALAETSVTDESVAEETVVNETTGDEGTTEATDSETNGFDEAAWDEEMIDESITDEVMVDEAYSDEATEETVTEETVTEETVTEETVTDGVVYDDFAAETYESYDDFNADVTSQELVTEESVVEEAASDAAESTEASCEVCPSQVESFEDGYCQYFNDDYLCDLASEAVEAEPSCPEGSDGESICPYTGNILDRGGDELVAEEEAMEGEGVVTTDELDATQEAVELNELGCGETGADESTELADEFAGEESADEGQCSAEPAADGAIFVYQFYECEGYLYYDYDGYDLLAVDVLEMNSQAAAEDETEQQAAEGAPEAVAETPASEEPAASTARAPFPYLAPGGLATWLVEQETEEHPLKTFVEAPAASSLPATEPVLEDAPRAAQVEVTDREQASVTPTTNPVAENQIDWEAAAGSVIRSSRVAMDEAFGTIFIVASAWNVPQELEVARSFTPSEQR